MLSTPYAAIMASPLGKLGLCISESSLLQLDFLPLEIPEYLPSARLAKMAVAQLHAYFHDPTAVFTLPQSPPGTPFQQRVWHALAAIPLGATVTYGELAARLGTSARAIGGACRSNPLPIFIPCHRVVSRRGLGGYSGATGGSPLATKMWLLQHEANGADHRF
jgi:methylated-DNA-[protein]-cysteine S-methyltransferase